MSDIKRTNASDGSRTDAHGGNSRGELQEAIARLEAERTSLVARRQQIDTRLGMITGHIRVSQRLPQREYAKLVAEQGELKKESVVLVTRCNELKQQIKALNIDLNDHDKLGGLNVTNDILREILRELQSIKSKLTNR